jgi:hypothetical protein
MDDSILTAKNEQVSQAIASLASAESEVKRLEHLEAEQTAKKAGIANELAGLESSMGERVLDGAKAEKVMAEVTGKRTELELSEKVLEALKPRITKARRAGITAKAQVLRVEADRLAAHATERQKKTNKFLKSLEDFEGCAYTPDAEQPTQTMSGGKHLGGVYSTFTLKLPFTQMLFNRAGALRANADMLEAGRPLPADLITGGPIGPFEIDYKDGRVLLPEPIAYEPIKIPTRQKDPTEALEKDTGRLDMGAGWQHV